MSELVVSLVVNLANDRMKIKRDEYQKELKSHRIRDSKETEALVAGYNKALNDMREVFMTLAEM